MTPPVSLQYLHGRICAEQLPIRYETMHFLNGKCVGGVMTPPYKVSVLGQGETVMKFSTSLKLNHIFRRLYHTSGFADGYLVLYARKNRTEENRVGITVSKKLGKAHIRNRTRRRLREVYRLNEEKFLPGWDIVVVARSKAVDAPFDKLVKSYLTLAGKARLLQEDGQ